MKKLFKKVTLIALASLITVTSVACTPSGATGEKVDKNKTQINVSHYLGGVGQAWIDKIETEFESLYADYKGENGKEGVQIIVNHHKKEGDTLADDLKSNPDEVYFTDKSKYHDMVTQGSLLDLTSIVTAEDSNGVSLEERLSEQQRGYYKRDNKYYALPHYESFGGLFYNKNLFNDRQLYFAKGGVPSEYCDFTQQNNANPATGEAPTSVVDYLYTNYAGEKSAGPDGKYGTDDDGLPATFDEFFALCDYMVGEKSITPFTWSGQFGKAYIHYLMKAIWADVEGAKGVNAAYNFNGDDIKIVDQLQADGTVTFKTVDITNENAYLTYQSEGQYRAYEFVIKMLSKGEYLTDNSDKGLSHTHTQAQREFILSEFEPAKWTAENRRIAMIVEGNYWENEARDMGIFENVPQGKTTSYGYLPVPKPDASRIGTKSTITEEQGNIAFIRGNVSENKKQLLLDFLAYCYSEEKLIEFTQLSGMTRGLEYNLENISGVGITDMAKSLINVKKDADMVYMVSGNPLYVNHQTYFMYRFGVNGYDWVLDYLVSGNRTTKNVFDLLKQRRTESIWKSTMGIN